MGTSKADSNHIGKCSFCFSQSEAERSKVISCNELAYAILDKYPVSEGHTLIVLNRHLSSLFGASTEELAAIAELIGISKSSLDKSFSPDGYNIGINDGKAAGQTIEHLHVHIIPRYKGDVVDPRGGIRWIVPEKADYWSQHE